MAYGGGDTGAGDARAMENERQARIARGLEDINRTFSGFDDSFYNRRADEFERYQMPEATRQYDETKRNLSYSLARSGLLKSGVAADKNASLDREFDSTRRNIADAATSSANSLRGEVENQRSQLVSQLQASADPTASAQLASANAARFSAPQTFTPIGNFFQNWTNTYLANQQARAYDDSVPAMFDWGGGGSSSSRIVKGN